MTIKSLRTTMTAGAITLALGSTALMVPSAAAAEEKQGSLTAQCKTFVTGGTFNWGVKNSFRQYIQGNVARGSWSLHGNVHESDPSNRAGKDFQFKFEVDPKTSTIEVNDEGKVTKADIRTKPSKITFEGHKGSLYTNFLNPYVIAEGDGIQGGAGYLAYYVPGKGMTEYTPEDRIEQNKVTGSDVFSKGQGTWTVGTGTINLDASNMMYVPKPGTDSWNGILEGVDALFMGLYNADYKPELDDINVVLTTEEKCSLPQTPPPAADPDPNIKPGGNDTQGTSSNNQGSSGSEMTSGHWKKFTEVWNFLLGAAGILGMFAILAHALKVSGVFEGGSKQINDFLHKGKLR